MEKKIIGEKKRIDFLYSYLMLHPDYGTNIAREVDVKQNDLDMKDIGDLKHEGKVCTILKKMFEEMKIIKKLEKEEVEKMRTASIIPPRERRRGPTPGYYTINLSYLNKKISIGQKIPKDYVDLIQKVSPKEEKCIDFINKHISPDECLFYVSIEINNFLEYHLSSVKIVEMKEMATDLIKKFKDENTSEKDMRNKLADLFYRSGDLISEFGPIVSIYLYNSQDMKRYIQYFTLTSMILMADLGVCYAFDDARRMIEEKESQVENLKIKGLIKEGSIEKLIKTYPEDVKRWLEILHFFLEEISQTAEKVMDKLVKDGFLRLNKLIDSINQYGEKENKTPEEAERYFIDISSVIIDNFGPRHPSSFIETI